MVEPLPKIDRGFFNILVCGAEKTFHNAEKLYFEATLLAKAGATARALCLHQISLEECSKIEMMGVWATSLLAGIDVDQKKILATFRRHSSKNKNNAYMLVTSVKEKNAMICGDLEVAREEFKKLQLEFDKSSNHLKNASLYVDWKDGEFISPSEQITLEMLSQIIKRNETFLGQAQNSLKMLKRLNESPVDLQDLIVEFIAIVEKTRAEKPENLVASSNAIVQSFLDAGIDRIKSKAG